MSSQEPLFSFEPGLSVKVSGLRGTFRVIGTDADSSVQVYGGTRQQFRSFPARRLQPVKPNTKDRIDRKIVP